MRRWLLPAVVALLQVPAVRTGGEAYDGLAEQLGPLPGVLGGLVLVWRRSRPLTATTAAVGLYLLDVACRGPVLPLAVAVAVFTAAREAAAPRGPLAAVAGAVGAGAGLYAITEDSVAATYTVGLLLVAVAGLLLAVRAERSETDRRTAVAAERLRLARDLHDVVGHGMGAITVQAGAARMAVAAGAVAEAEAALGQIETAGRQVLRDVRWLVGLLREDPAAPTLADVPALVDAARRAGLSATLRSDGPLGDVPADAAEATYRVAQEALTNVLRHSDASTVDLRLAVTATQVALTVMDDGRPASAEPVAGNGITGMRERATALGGEVAVGPVAAEPPGTGWSVALRLPLRRGGR